MCRGFSQGIYISSDGGIGAYLKLFKNKYFHTVFIINLSLREMVEISQEADFIHLETRTSH